MCVKEEGWFSGVTLTFTLATSSSASYAPEYVAYNLHTQTSDICAAHLASSSWLPIAAPHVLVLFCLLESLLL